MAIDQIAQLGLSSLKVIYYSEQLFNRLLFKKQQQTAFGTGFPGENYPVFPIIWSMFKVAREQVAKGWNLAGAMTTYRYYRARAPIKIGK